MQAMPGMTLQKRRMTSWSRASSILTLTISRGSRLWTSYKKLGGRPESGETSRRSRMARWILDINLTANGMLVFRRSPCSEPVNNLCLLSVDTSVQIFRTQDALTAGDAAPVSPLLSLKGHEQDGFGLAWNPLVQSMLPA